MGNLIEKQNFYTEQVLVVPDSLLREYLGDEGHFFKIDHSMLKAVRNNAVFIDRFIAEENLNYRQIIPYVIIRRGTDKEEYFLFRRLSTQGENRLHDKRSLGAGGHINPVDKHSDDLLHEGLMRELNEELFLPDCYELEFAGWIYSTIDAVASVHAGMVYFLNIPDGDIEIREKDKMTGKWCDKNKLKTYIDDMEGWSKIVMEFLIQA